MPRAMLFAAALLAAGLTTHDAGAVDTSPPIPSLALARAKIKAKDFKGALSDLRDLVKTQQTADVYSLLGFTSRKTGDYRQSLVYYQKALELDASHKGAREYLGELYVETGELEKAKEQLAVLTRLCPSGCEERSDLQQAIAAKAR